MSEANCTAREEKRTRGHKRRALSPCTSVVLLLVLTLFTFCRRYTGRGGSSGRALEGGDFLPSGRRNQWWRCRLYHTRGWFGLGGLHGLVTLHYRKSQSEMLDRYARVWAGAKHLIKREGDAGMSVLSRKIRKYQPEAMLNNECHSDLLEGLSTRLVKRIVRMREIRVANRVIARSQRESDGNGKEMVEHVRVLEGDDAGSKGLGLQSAGGKGLSSDGRGTVFGAKPVAERQGPVAEGNPAATDKLAVPERKGAAAGEKIPVAKVRAGGSGLVAEGSDGRSYPTVLPRYREISEPEGSKLSEPEGPKGAPGSGSNSDRYEAEYLEEKIISVEELEIRKGFERNFFEWRELKKNGGTKENGEDVSSLGTDRDVPFQFCIKDFWGRELSAFPDQSGYSTSNNHIGDRFHFRCRPHFATLEIVSKGFSEREWMEYLDTHLAAGWDHFVVYLDEEEKRFWEMVGVSSPLYPYIRSNILTLHHVRPPKAQTKAHTHAFFNYRKKTWFLGRVDNDEYCWNSQFATCGRF